MWPPVRTSRPNCCYRCICAEHPSETQPPINDHPWLSPCSPPPPLSAAETMDPLRFTSPLLPATSLCRANFSTLLTFSQRWKRRPSAGWPALEKTGKPGNRTFDESLDITVFASILAFLLFPCFFLCFLCFFAFVFVFFFLERSCMRWEKVREAIVSVELEIERGTVVDGDTEQVLVNGISQLKFSNWNFYVCRRLS